MPRQAGMPALTVAAAGSMAAARGKGKDRGRGKDKASHARALMAHPPPSPRVRAAIRADSANRATTATTQEIASDLWSRRAAVVAVDYCAAIRVSRSITNTTSSPTLVSAQVNGILGNARSSPSRLKPTSTTSTPLA